MADNVCKCYRCGQETYIWHAEEIKCKNGKHTFCDKCIREMKDKVDPIKVLQEKVECLEWLLINNLLEERYSNEYYDTLDDKIKYLAFKDYE